MNYIRARSIHNVIPILWIKLDEDLILSFPTLTLETELGAQSEMVKKKIKKLTSDEVGNEKQIY